MAMRAPVLQVEAVQARHGHRPVLGGNTADEGIRLRLDAGEWLALIGPNGCGKTTLLRCIAGIHPLHAGHIRVLGHDLRTQPLQAKDGLGMAIAPEALPALLSARECLQLFAAARGLRTVPQASLDLLEALGFMPWLDWRVGSLSLGGRQKLGIALGLMGEPPLLLLDEPLNGLDLRSAAAFQQHLRQRVSDGTAVLMATHALDAAERHATRALVLMDGRLAAECDAATLAAIRADPQRSLEQVLLDALPAPGTGAQGSPASQ